MILQAYQRDGWYKIVAENQFGERSEYGSTPGDHIYEYIEKHHRLNRSFVEYWLKENNREEDQIFLDFILRANDHRTPRKLRLPNWKESAGLSYGEIPLKPKGPGDVVIHGSVARMGGDANAMHDLGVVETKEPKKRKLWGRI